MMKNVLFTFVLFLNFACATHKDSKNEKLIVNKVQKEEEKSKELVNRVDDHMRKLVADAKERGKFAVDFLASDLFLKANDASMRGDSLTAVFIYKHLVELAPSDVFLKKKYSLELIRIGKLNEALTPLKVVFEKTKKSDEAAGLILGGLYVALEQRQKATSVYKEVLKHHSGSEEACVFLAKSYGIEEKFKAAEKLLLNCEAKSEGKAIFSYFLGKMALQKNDKVKAAKFFERALKIDPNYHQAVMGKGLLLEERGNNEKALRVYKKFLEKEPMNYAVLSRVVYILFNQKKLSEVIGYAERLSSLDSTDLNLKVKLGLLYSDAGEKEKAKVVFKEILKEVPDSDKVTYFLATLYEESRDFDLAIEYFSKIQEASTLFHEANIKMAVLMQKTIEVAAEDEKAKRVDNYFSFVKNTSEKYSALKLDLYTLQASYYEEAGQVHRAIESLLSVQDHEKFSRNHEYQLASLYEKIKNYEKSRHIISTILAQEPDNAQALNFLGYSLLEVGDDMERAFTLISKAVKLAPEDGYIRDSLGWYYYKVGDLHNALKHIKKAQELTKTDLVINKHLAIVYRDLEKYDLAHKYFSEALKNCRFENERLEVQEAIQKMESKRLPASK